MAGITRSFAPLASALAEALSLDALAPGLTANLSPMGDHGFFAWKDVPYRGHTAVDALPSASAEAIDPKHHLDVYMPSEPFPRPLLPTVLFVHGGAWQRGDRQHRLNTYGNVGIACARAGILGLVMSYRLSPQVQHPEHVRDVAAAIAWARHAARVYGGDPGKLVLAGHSAGAQLAMIAVAQRRWLEECGVTEPVHQFVKGVVGLCGVYNLPRLAHTPLGPYIVEPAFGADPEGWRAASVVHCAGPYSPLRKIPALLINAEDDFNLEQDAEELEARLHVARDSSDAEVAGERAAHADDGTGARVERAVVDGCNHVTLVGGIGQPGDVTTDLLTNFVHRVCAS